MAVKGLDRGRELIWTAFQNGINPDGTHPRRVGDGNPLLGTLNLFTGKITPLGNHFQSPKGLLFVSNNGAMSQDKTD
jgi:hypothetical protein